MDRVEKNKTISIFFLLGMIWSLSNCSDIKNADQWEDVIIDADLSEDLIYKQLDREKEIFSMLEEPDSLTRRTSAVSSLLFQVVITRLK